MSSALIEKVNEDYCTLGEAAQLLSVSTVTIWRWINAGKIEAERLGREVLILRLSVEAIRLEKTA